MKKILFLILGLLFIRIASADTVNIDWMVDGQTYTQTSCNIGDDLILPTAPTKYGYTFRGWETYTQLEYIEGTGTQYIDTVVYGNLRTALVIDFQNTVPSSTHRSAILGGDLSNTNSAINLLITLDNNTIRTCRFGNVARDFPRNLVSNNVRYTIRMDKNGIILNDTITVVSFGNLDTPFTTSGTLWLFRSNNASTIETSSLRVYSAKIYYDDTLVRDFIPVRRYTDGAIGMLDTVSGKFFGNAGTGTFIAGPDL